MLGNKAYAIAYADSVIKIDIPNLPKKDRLIIKGAIEERLALDPMGFGKPLRYSMWGLRSLRVGNYRIIYQIKFETNTVIVVAIGHRKDVYEGNFFLN